MKNNKTNLYFCLVIIISVIPQLVFAFDNSTFKSIIESFVGLLGITTPIVASLAVMFFFWGMVKFIYSSGDEKQIEYGKNIMKWGIVALFVMFSLWGIVKIFAEIIGGNIKIPQL
jgi:hypothetical protein